MRRVREQRAWIMAGRIPEKFIDDLLSRTDIVDVIDMRVPLKKAGKDYKACCPFHEEKTPSFTVSADKQFYYCFGCGARGNVIGFMMEYDRMSFPEAVRELASAAGMDVPEAAAAVNESVSRSAELLDWVARANTFYQKQLREHPRASEAVEYLKKRGLSGKIAASFGIGYAPEGWDNLIKALEADNKTMERLLEAGLVARRDNGGCYDRFRDRVMFPIEDYRGRVVGFGGRVMDGGEPKYLNSPETPVFHKGREVYGLYRARDAIRREQRVLVVEGYMDVVALAQHGIENVVATLGTATTREHLDRLYRYAPEVVFAFDGDRAGRDAAWRAMENALPVMGEGRQASFLFLPEGEDPDSLVRTEGAAAFEARIAQAQPLGKYMIETLAEDLDLTRDDARARLVSLARPLIDKMPAGILRELVLERLEKKARIEKKRLDQLLGSALMDSSKASSARAGTTVAHKAQSGFRMSPMRYAIALLLQYPREIARILDERLVAQAQTLAQNGADLLCALIDILAKTEEKNLDTAHLIEKFRETEHFQAVEKLAFGTHSAVERPTEELDMGREFSDVLCGLRLAEISERLAALHEGEMDKANKAEYQRLMVEKQQLKNI